MKLSVSSVVLALFAASVAYAGPVLVETAAEETTSPHPTTRTIITETTSPHPTTRTILTEDTSSPHPTTRTIITETTSPHPTTHTILPGVPAPDATHTFVYTELPADVPEPSPVLVTQVVSSVGGEASTTVLTFIPKPTGGRVVTATILGGEPVHTFVYTEIPAGVPQPSPTVVTKVFSTDGHEETSVFTSFPQPTNFRIATATVGAVSESEASPAPTETGTRTFVYTELPAGEPEPTGVVVTELYTTDGRQETIMYTSIPEPTGGHVVTNTIPPHPTSTE